MRGPRSNGAAFVRVTVLLAACALGGVACTDGTTPDCSDAQCQVLVEEAAAGDAGTDAGDAGDGDGAVSDANADSGSVAVADSGAVSDASAVADSRADASDGAPE
jgi:hypothetical protein